MARTPPASVRETMAEKRKARLRAQVAEAFPAAPPPADGPRTPFVLIAHGKIRPDPDNARKEFDHDALVGLAATIASHGLLQPLVVTEADAEGVHTLVAGERRWRAIELLIEDGPDRWPVDRPIPCRLETADDRARMEAALIENLQRVDLNHMEAGLAFETLGARFHLSNKVIAEKIGRSNEYVQQHRRLSALNAEDQERVRAGRMPFHDALRILAQPKPEPLTPSQRLLVAEVLHKSAVSPLRGGYNYYGGSTECAYDAASKDLAALTKRQILTFNARDWTSQRASIGIGYQGREVAAGAELEVLRTPGREADVTLIQLRIDAGVPKPEQGATYSTPYGAQLGRRRRRAARLSARPPPAEPAPRRLATHPPALPPPETFLMAPMNDRDALIERANGLADDIYVEGDDEDTVILSQSVATETARTIRALISLASPSPAQTEREPLAQPDENGCWYGVERCTLPHCDCSERDKAAKSPSPAQWPEDVVERVARIIDPSSWRVMDGYLAETLRKYKGENAGYDPASFKHKESMAIARAALATLPPPEPERRRAMTDPHTWWFLEDANGRWLENIDHGTFTDDPNQALKWPNGMAADYIRRGLRSPLWTLKATEHMWVEPTLPPPEDERVKGLIEALRAVELRVDELNTKALPQKRITQDALDGIKRITRSALASYRGGA